MKEYDKVELITDRPEYEKVNIFKGMIGTICQPEIRFDTFLVYFEGEKLKDGYMCFNIKIEDLSVYEVGFATDKTIYDELPEGRKDWWCKVEDGFIINLKGERKNKIPYDYDS